MNDPTAKDPTGYWLISPPEPPRSEPCSNADATPPRESSGPPTTPPPAPDGPMVGAQAASRQAGNPPTREAVLSGHAEDLASERILTRSAPTPRWRRTRRQSASPAARPGPPRVTRRHRDLVARIQEQPAPAHHRIAVMSYSGGVGKTSIAVGLGATLASLRGDKIIAIDAHPNGGTLGDKVVSQTSATIRDVAAGHRSLDRYAAIRSHTSQTPSGLEILASDPTASDPLGHDEYRIVADVVERFYPICLTDCGAGLAGPLPAAILERTDQLILAASPAVDGARSAIRALDWLTAHGHRRLAATSIVVISMAATWRSSLVDLNVLHDHLNARAGWVVQIPHDPHLETGAEFDLNQLRPATRQAYLHLAARITIRWRPDMNSQY